MISKVGWTHFSISISSHTYTYSAVGWGEEGGKEKETGRRGGEEGREEGWERMRNDEKSTKSQMLPGGKGRAHHHVSEMPSPSAAHFTSSIPHTQHREVRAGHRKWL